MISKIKILNSQNETVWKTTIDRSTYEKVKKQVTEGGDAVPIFPATLIPVRTNNLKNFSEDFFLPTTINHAIKVKGVAKKILAILASLILDLVTLPIRLLSCIPRMIYNAMQSQHPLLRFFLDNKVDPQLLDSGYVRIRLQRKERSFFPTGIVTHNDGTSHVDHTTNKYWEERMVNFIDLPMYEGSDYLSGGIS